MNTLAPLSGADRMPPPTAAIVMFASFLEAQRASFGMDHCNEHLIGNARRLAGRIPTAPELNSGIAVAHDQTRLVYAQICAACPHTDCPMKGWDITPPLS